MTRHDESRRTLIIAMAAAVATVVGLTIWQAADGAKGATMAAQAQPNVVVIMVDDMRADDLAAMPTTRQLLAGDNGANYTNAYVSTPLCCPSRATFLTGQYGHNNDVWDNDGPHGGIAALDDSETLPVWMQRAGYRTVMLGKYLNKYGNGGSAETYVPPGWSHWVGQTDPWKYRDFHVTEGSSGPGSSSQGTSRLVENQYVTNHLATRAVNQIEAHVPGDKPMFMWLSNFAPHVAPTPVPGQEFVPTEAQYTGDSNAGLPASDAFDEAVVADKPPWIRQLPRLTAADEDRILTHRRARRDALQSVEDTVAEVVAALRQAGELDNTVIVFTSDNGFMQGEHRIQTGKTIPYVESAQVPLLISGPGFTPGVHREPVMNVDLAPTITAVAGAAAGRVPDGMSLLTATPTDRALLLEYKGRPTKIGSPTYSGVIQGDDWYVEYTGGAKELYNMGTDPWQTRNLAAVERVAPKKQRLAATLDGLRHCEGGGCR